MTLSRFLRDYLYIPLGGNRRGHVTVNIMITMLLGGLWHGAAWTFVAWGGLHGLFLVIHRFWARWRGGSVNTGMVAPIAGGLLTFTCVTLAWVLFRAESFDAAWRIYMAMAGLGGITIPAGMEGVAPIAQASGLRVANLQYLQGYTEFAWLLAGGLICFLAPNAAQLLARHQAALLPDGMHIKPGRLQWQPTLRWSLGFAGLFSCAVLSLFRVSEFLYFQF